MVSSVITEEYGHRLGIISQSDMMPTSSSFKTSRKAWEKASTDGVEQLYGRFCTLLESPGENEEELQTIAGNVLKNLNLKPGKSAVQTLKEHQFRTVLSADQDEGVLNGTISKIEGALRRSDENDEGKYQVLTRMQRIRASLWMEKPSHQTLAKYGAVFLMIAGAYQLVKAGTLALNAAATLPIFNTASAVKIATVASIVWRYPVSVFFAGFVAIRLINLWTGRESVIARTAARIANLPIVKIIFARMIIIHRKQAVMIGGYSVIKKGWEKIDQLFHANRNLHMVLEHQDKLNRGFAEWIASTQS